MCTWMNRSDGSRMAVQYSKNGARIHAHHNNLLATSRSRENTDSHRCNLLLYSCENIERYKKTLKFLEPVCNSTVALTRKCRPLIGSLNISDGFAGKSIKSGVEIAAALNTLQINMRHKSGILSISNTVHLSTSSTDLIDSNNRD